MSTDEHTNLAGSLTENCWYTIWYFSQRSKT